MPGSQSTWAPQVWHWKPVVRGIAPAAADGGGGTAPTAAPQAGQQGASSGTGLPQAGQRAGAGAVSGSLCQSFRLSNIAGDHNVPRLAVEWWIRRTE